MALNTRMSASGYGVSPSGMDPVRRLNREFMAAVASVAEARAAGRMNDEEADDLLRLMTALMAQARVSAMVNRLADRLNAPDFGGERIGELLASAMESDKTRKD